MNKLIAIAIGALVILTGVALAGKLRESVFDVMAREV